MFVGCQSLLESSQFVQGVSILIVEPPDQQSNERIPFFFLIELSPLIYCM